LNSRSTSEWYQIRNDLNMIANAYGINSRNDRGYGYGNDDGRGRGRGQYPGSRWP
jgi:hypothetical protein